uniref:Ribosomal protein S18 n=1 Tax=Panagrolaimus sp. ES5 TaxID=591445 RepID=A0AC34GQW0_9BILA
MTQNYLKNTTPKPSAKNHGWKAFLQQFDDFDRLNSFSQSPSNFTTFIPKKQQQNGFFKQPETRRFSPRKLKKNNINYDYSFMQSSTVNDVNPSQIESAKPLSFKKLQNRKSFQRSQASRLERKQYGRDSNSLQTNIKPQRKQRGYNRLQLLGKKMRILSNVNSTGAAIPRKLQRTERPASRRFMKFMHRRRAKRSMRFSDSKDHYYKEKRFKVRV